MTILKKHRLTRYPQRQHHQQFPQSTTTTTLPQLQRALARVSSTTASSCEGKKNTFLSTSPTTPQIIIFFNARFSLLFPNRCSKLIRKFPRLLFYLYFFFFGSFFPYRVIRRTLFTERSKKRKGKKKKGSSTGDVCIQSEEGGGGGGGGNVINKLLGVEFVLVLVSMK